MEKVPWAISISTLFVRRPTISEGDTANAAEQLYVKVNDFKVAYNGDPLDMTAQEWKQRRIDLASLGVDLTNVTRIAIGFGDGTTFGAGGAGVVYFDDIGL